MASSGPTLPSAGGGCGGARTPIRPKACTRSGRRWVPAEMQGAGAAGGVPTRVLGHMQGSRRTGGVLGGRGHSACALPVPGCSPRARQCIKLSFCEGGFEPQSRCLQDGVGGTAGGVCAQRSPRCRSPLTNRCWAWSCPTSCRRPGAGPAEEGRGHVFGEECCGHWEEAVQRPWAGSCLAASRTRTEAEPGRVPEGGGFEYLGPGGQAGAELLWRREGTPSIGHLPGAATCLARIPGRLVFTPHF